jgi:xylulokinase
MAILLGLDIGTTSTIGILIDTDGAVLALADAPVTLHARHPGWAEQDPEQWWANTGTVCRALLAEAGLDGRQVGAVGVTGMVPALVTLDADGRCIRRSIQQSDGRTGAEVAELAREVDAAAFLRRTGNGINQQLVAPRLRWLARHEPDAFARIATVLGSYDFIAGRLAGAPALERNWALEAGFLDLSTGAVAEDLVALGGIGLGTLPPLRPGEAVIGTVTRAAAAHTGLAEGTPVVAGAADHVASAFVAGIAAPGDLLIKFGGAGDVLLATAEPRPDPRLFLDFHVVPGLYMPNGCMAASGSLLNWFVAVLGREEAARALAEGARAHARLDALAASVRPGSEGLVLLPYFLGEKTPIQDPAARGTLVGLGLHHDLGHLWRAFLEAVAYGFRHHLEVARDIGYPVTRVIASDGGTRSAVWMQIAADVLGRPVQLLEGHPGSCLGAAYVAGVAIGALPGWGEMGRFVRPARVVEPVAAATATYDEGYAAYRALYDALKGFYPRLSRYRRLIRQPARRRARRRGRPSAPAPAAARRRPLPAHATRAPRRDRPARLPQCAPRAAPSPAPAPR